MNASALANALTNSGDSANTIALAAAVLAAGAFVVALLQAILEYAGSASSRHKCNFSAIHGSSKHVKYRWSLRSWRMKVYYPVLDFDRIQIMELIFNSSLKAINSPTSPMNRIRAANSDWGWVSLGETQRITRRNIADPFTMLQGSNGPVTTADLTWGQYITFLRWKLRHPGHITTRPRASWAQLLLAFGIQNSKDITYKYADADLIPNSFDVPVQRIKLFDLGVLALLLGFTEVKINPKERKFEASGPFGTITTLAIPDAGKVLRFEGDIFAMKQSFSKGSPLVLLQCISTMNGNLPFSADYIMNGYFYPLQLLKEATAGNWDKEKFREELSALVRASFQGIGFSQGQIAKESTLFQEILKDAFETNVMQDFPKRRQGDSTPIQRAYRTLTNLSLEQKHDHLHGIDTDDPGNFEIIATEWQDKTGQTIPTVLAAAILAALAGAKIAYPSRLLLEPFLPWIRYQANKLQLPNLPNPCVSYELLRSFRNHDLNFVRSYERFWLSRDYIGLTEIMTGGRESWIFHDIGEVYFDCAKDIQDKIVIKDSDSQPTGEVGCILFPDVIQLIGNYDPVSWAEAIEDVSLMSPYSFRPANMLWAQILFVDLSIYLYLLGVSALDKENNNNTDGSTRPTSRPLNPRFIAVYRAVADSWVVQSTAYTANDVSETVVPTDKKEVNPIAEVSLDDTETSKPLKTPRDSLNMVRSNHREAATFCDWQFARALGAQPELVFSEDPEIQQKRINQLACLLELRGMLVLAFIFTCPDSTDVYLAEGSDVEMPMI